jgi:hypothetical protein
MFKIYQGTLQELGQAEVIQRSKTVDYTYIQVGEEMVKKVTTFNGLDGKLNSALGKTVTLHTKGRFLVAITTEDGKTYSTEEEGAVKLLMAIIVIITGVMMTFKTHFILGLPLFIMGGYMLYLRSQINSGASIPNAIQIPR